VSSSRRPATDRAPASSGIAVALYRRLLRLYPGALRERHGDEMAQVFAERVARERRQRRGARRRVARMLLRDLAVSLPDAWRGERARRLAAAGPGRRWTPLPSRLLGELLQDVRLGLRWLRRAPGTAVLALLTLALGIGATTAMFSVLQGVLLEPLPYPEPDRVVRLMPARTMSAAQLDAIAEQASAFDTLAALVGWTLTLVGEGPPAELSATVASPALLEVLEAVPALGRPLNERDAIPGAEPVAMLSWGVWKERFGGDRAIVGRRIRLGGRGESSRTVVGVLPAGFDAAPWPTDVLVPVVTDRGSPDYQDMLMYWGLGRLRAGAAIDEASTELRAIVERLAQAERPLFTETALPDARVVTYLHARVGEVRSRLWLLLGAVLVVLLIACGNVANLLLARASQRERELSLRSALGAGRSRLLRQLLTESAVLAVLGGSIGVVLAAGGLSLLESALRDHLPRTENVAIDLRVLGFSLALALASALLFGAAPALRSSRGASRAVGGGGGRATGARRGFWLHRLLVGAEVALCIVLVVAAGLLSKSLLHLVRVDPGFSPQQGVSVRVVPPESRYPDADSRRRLYQTLEERLSSAPGVETAGAVNMLPLSRAAMSVGISRDGDPVDPGEEPFAVSYRLVTPGYPRAIGLPLLAGRALESSDQADAQPVGLINATLARQLFGDRVAVGETLSWDNGEPWFTVVGVVGDLRQTTLREQARPEVYVPYGRNPWVTAMHLVVRGPAGADLLATLRAVIAEVDHELPIGRATTLEEMVTRSVASAGLYARLFVLFGGVALALAAIGIYGVVGYTVSQRRREIGVRVAVGASARDILRSVVGQGMAAVAGGLVIGGAAALALGRLLSGLLFEVRPADPAVLVGSLLLLGAVALAACAVPALRATRVDPLETLSGE
jgi:putative ABC transport system permease protein